MDKLKCAVFTFAVLSIVGGAVVYMTGQQGLNRDSLFVVVFGSLTFILGLSLFARTLSRRQNRSK
jgi:Ca2+/H+ antiporter